MPLETATYIPQLDATNPAHTDQLNQADAHMRLIKSALKATWPNFIAAALQSTQAELDAVAHTGQIAAQNGATGAPSITFKTDATAGFRKNNTVGQVQIEGVLRGPGASPVGLIGDFAQPPARFATGGAAGNQASIDWLELDGSTYAVSDFPDLYAHLGVTYGGVAGTNFKVPNVKDTGRFRRSRTATLVYGQMQANQNLSHSHTGATDTAGAHAHNANVNDGGHAHTETGYTSGSSIGNAIILGIGATLANSTNNTTSAFTGITVGIDVQGAHAHNLTINASGGSEARPEAFVVISCIKT
jgi:microcystin-dependent protein